MGCCGVSYDEATALLEGRIPEALLAESESVTNLAVRLSSLKAERVLEVGAGGGALIRALTPFFRQAALVLFADTALGYYGYVADELRSRFLDLLYISGCKDAIATWNMYARYSIFVRRGGLIVFHNIGGVEMGKVWATLTSDADKRTVAIGGFGVLEVR